MLIPPNCSAIPCDRLVDKVAFTGSVATGRRVAAAAASHVAKVTLELGGKSPAIVFPGGDVLKTVEWVMFGCFWTNGQICSATSRLLLHEDCVRAGFLDVLAREARRVVAGCPLADADAAEWGGVGTGGPAGVAPGARPVRLGPLVSSRQRDKVVAFIEGAVAEGARVLAGGAAGAPTNTVTGAAHLRGGPSGAAATLAREGYFVAPTVLTGVTPRMRIFREEVFGPVLAVTTFRTEAEAVALANDCGYGLAAAVFSPDAAQLERVSRAVRCGIVWRNCSQPCFPQLPWGGCKNSGAGRDLGPNGLAPYLEPKALVTYVKPETPLCWYKDEAEYAQASKL